MYDNRSCFLDHKNICLTPKPIHLLLVNQNTYILNKVISIYLNGIILYIHLALRRKQHGIIL